MSDPIAMIAEHMGDVARRDEPLGSLTTYRVGGRAALLVDIVDETSLHRLLEVVPRAGVDVLVVGRGSNLLVADTGFPGVAVTLADAFATTEIDGTSVRAGGAASLPIVARRTAAAGLRGFEWAVGVPGSIGGAVRMNAGGHGSDMSATLRRVRVADLALGEDGVVTSDRLELGYRRSSIAPSQLVVWADLDLARGESTICEAEIADIVRWRRENQPGGPNAGSVFTNPEGDSAGRLIDESGARGLRQGTAAVSEKHANFIQADEGGSANDIARLMATVRDQVRERTGVELIAETRLVGFDARTLDAAGGAAAGNPP